MSTPILTSDPILAAVAATPGVTTAFLDDVVDLINRSPNLLAEINQLDATSLSGGGTAVIKLQNGQDNGGNTSYHSAVINIRALPSYNDGTLPYAGGSLIAGQIEHLTPAGTFVGTLAHEIGHWSDPQLGPLYIGSTAAYPIEQAVATEFTSEGKAAFSQYTAMSQIQATEASQPIRAGMANGNIMFDVDGKPVENTAMLQQVQALSSQSASAGAAACISYLGSQFWTTPVDGGTYLSTMWNGYGALGARDELGISEAQITQFQVQEAVGATLAGCTIQTRPSSGAALTYQIACPTPGAQQARITDSATGLLLATVDTTIPSVSAATQLSLAANNFSFAVVGNSIATVQGNNDALTLDRGDSLSLTGPGNTISLTGANGSADMVRLSGDQDHLLGGPHVTNLQLTLSGTRSMVSLTAGSATVTDGGTGTSIFGGASNVSYRGGGGGILVMGSGAATVAGAGVGTKETVFGGTSGLQYQGAQEYADVIGGAGPCTIHAGAGGGWYGGGNAGSNFLAASGGPTVLDAGGNGDTLVGASGGGTFLIAGSGNETLYGGNRAGESSIFLGIGADAVVAALGGSVVNTGTGTARIYGGGGHDQIWGGTGGADLFVAGKSGQLEIHGFRVGTDHLQAAGQATTAVVQGVGGTTITLSSGATILLGGVDAQGSSVFV